MPEVGDLAKPIIEDSSPLSSLSSPCRKADSTGFTDAEPDAKPLEVEPDAKPLEVVQPPEDLTDASPKPRDEDDALLADLQLEEDSDGQGEGQEEREERDMKPVNTLMAYLTGESKKVTPKMERKRSRTSMVSDAGPSPTSSSRVSRVSLRARASLARAASSDLLQTSDYVVSDILGEGQFGIVCACKRCSTDCDLAVKMIDKVETAMVGIIEEARMLYSLSHSNVVKLHDFFDEQFFACIVMDRFAGSLIHCMSLMVTDKESGGLNCFAIKHISSQMVLPLQYIHSQQILHRDVNADNYLADRIDMLDTGTKVVLSDFGLAVVVKDGERSKAKVGRKLFWAPEVVQGNYSSLADIWACGVTMFGLLDGRFPFASESDIKECHPRFRFDVHAACKDLVFKMLRKDEKKRISADSILAHAWSTGENIERIQEEHLDKEKTPKGATAKARLQKKPTFKRGRSDEEVSHRRRLLLERILAGAPGIFKKSEGAEAIRKRRKTFTVNEPGSRCTAKYAWWPQGKVEEGGLLSVEGLPTSPATGMEHIVKATLKQHNIDVKRFGKASAKSLQDLTAEISVGASRLMLDATSHKKLVRVVRSVTVHIRTDGDVSMPALERQTLVQTSCIDAEGTESYGFRLPSVLQEPYENVEQASQRILREILGLETPTGLVAFGRPRDLETEEVSSEYPGLTTVNCQRVVQFVPESCDERVLAQLRLTLHEEWSYKGADGCARTFRWLSQEDAEALPDLEVENCAELAGAGSRLVSPHIGPTLEELKAYLQAAKIDISPATHKSLEDLYAEARKGDASLVLDGAGIITHVVDVLLLVLTDASSTCILVEVERAPTSGPKTKRAALPSVKRRPDENHFFTAWHILEDILAIDCELVTINRNDISFFENVLESQKFPGLKSVVRKCVMKGTVNATAASAT